ncbi:MAG: 2-C-methyl-D-erythritol 2,4-cyclodiphosphate synthase [Eubacteriales bacterium]|nr:2-C-methyl-D-erythritol 2,4-cyclodiphosphate synthase [Eubacteriales bacterium]
MAFEYRSSIGQDSHRFVDRLNRETTAVERSRPLMLGGVKIGTSDALPAGSLNVGLSGNSDADVVLHALTNAISGLTGVNILGKISDELCLVQGITDSRVYLEKALDYLGDWQICHVSCTYEGKRPHLAVWIDPIRQQMADLLGLDVENIGFTATTGEGLTDFGRGDGAQVFCILTARRPELD